MSEQQQELFEGNRKLITHRQPRNRQTRRDVIRAAIDCYMPVENSKNLAACVKRATPGLRMTDCKDLLPLSPCI
jgi:hypothetical protein